MTRGRRHNVMQEVVPKDEYRWKVPEWLDQNVQPQDSVSRYEGGEEPMVRANHSASDLNARKQLWKRAQIQMDRDGRPRIPVQSGVKEAPDVGSLAAKRRGVSAERQQRQRETSRHRTLKKRREGKCAEEWERKDSKVWYEKCRSIRETVQPSPGQVIPLVRSVRG